MVALRKAMEGGQPEVAAEAPAGDLIECPQCKCQFSLEESAPAEAPVDA